MVKQVDRKDAGLFAVLCRKSAHATQGQVGSRAGIDQSDLSKIERGEDATTREKLEDIAEATAVRKHLVGPTLRFLQAFRLARGLAGSGATRDTEPVLASVAEAAVLAAAPACLGVEARPERVPDPEEEARELAELCSRLSQARAPQLLVEGLREYQRPEVCLWLCQASAEQVTADPHRAQLLAAAAARLAELLAARDSRQPDLRCLALARLGNARRACGDLPGAEQALFQAEKLWLGGHGRELVPEWRLYDLKASVRRDQRRYGEALGHHAQALAAAGGASEARGRALLNKAGTLEQKGDHEQSLATLDAAEPLLDRADERLMAVLSFNRAVNLDALGRHEEVAELLPQVRNLVKQPMDVIRLIWLEARVLRSRGQKDEALELFERVRAAFTKEKIPYHAALATLELAELLLERSRAGEVKALAEEMLWVFAKQEVEPEARKALRLFCDAAAREAVTVDLVRRVITEVRRAGRG